MSSPAENPPAQLPAHPDVTVRWTLRPGHAEDAARSLIGALTDSPQRSTLAPAVAPVRGSAADEPSEAPVSFRLDESAVDRPASTAIPRSRGARRPDRGVASPALLRRIEALASVINAPDAAAERRTLVAVPSGLPAYRGGAGGRQAHRNDRTVDDALEDMRVRFGEPSRVTGVGCQMFVWTAEEGSGIGFGRMSSTDIRQGETAAGQIGTIHDWLVRDQGVTPRIMVMTVDNSGSSRYEDRPDLLLAERLMAQDWCEWVAWRHVDRIARDHLPAEQHWRQLRDHDVGLYLYGLRRRVNWDQDEIQLRALLMGARMEAQAVTIRTQEAVLRRWLEAGRGNPGSLYFATQRDLDGHLVEDRDQMVIVHHLYDRYAGLTDSVATTPSGPASMRSLSAEVAERFGGARLSPDTINRILRDPMYVTGEWWASYKGQQYAGRRIAWTRPVPMSTYARVQQLLIVRRGALRGEDGQGLYALNGLLRHAACRRTPTDNGRRVSLRGSIGRGGTPRYYHTPVTPTTCRGYSLDQGLVEPPVMAALRQLVDHPVLLQAWDDRRIGSGLDLPVGRLVTDDDVGRLRVEQAALRRRRDQLDREAVVELSADADLERWRRLTAAMEQRLTEIGSRLESARTERLPALPATARDRQPDLVALVESVLSDIAPESAQQRAQRVATVASLLAEVVVHDRSDGGLELELVAYLTPPDPKRS